MSRSQRWVSVALAVVAVGAVVGVNLMTCGGAPDAANARAPAAARDLATHGVIRTGSAFVTAAETDGDGRRSRLEGQVIDEQAQPVGGAQIRLLPGDAVVTSEADGSFGFERLPFRGYRLAARAGERYSDTAVVSFSETSEPVTLRLHRGTTLVLHVLADTTPLAGAEAILDDAIHAATGRDGVVRIPGLGPRFHHVAVSAPGRATAQVSLDVAEDPGGTLERTVKLRTGAPLGGTVVGPDGKPVADATVEIDALGDRASSQRATTDRAGAWHVAAVAAGTYRLTATSKTYGPAAGLELALDGTTPRPDIVVKVAFDAQLVGTVVDAAGQPLPGATVIVSDRAGASFDEKTDVHGAFEMLGIAAGAYDVIARKGGQASPSSQIALVTDARTELRLITQDVQITGTVVDPRGEPIAEARVLALPMRAVRTASSFANDATDAKGRFHLDGLEPGTYTVSATWPDQKSRKVGEGLPVTTGTKDVKLTLEPPATLVGRVTLDGQPVPYYGILITEHPEWAFMGEPIAERSPDGRFTVRGVEPGMCGLVILGPGTAQKIIRVTIEKGKTTDLGEIAMAHGQRIGGHVRDGSGAPVPGADVFVGRGAPRTDDAPVKQWFQGEYQTTTDAAGAYLFDGIAPMPHTQITAVEATHGTSPATTLPSGDATVDFVLAAAGGIDGTIDNYPGGLGLVNARPAANRTDVHSADVDVSGAFHLDGLPAGDYVVGVMPLPGKPGVPAVHALVLANQRAAVKLVLPTKTVTVEITVTGAPCKRLALALPGAGPPTSDDLVGVARCQDNAVELAGIGPGAYRACITGACVPLTVADAPATQTFALKFPSAPAP